MSHHSKLTCLCISHRIRMPVQLFLTFIHQVWSFGQVWTEDLHGEVTAICWRFTLSFQRANTYAPLSHQLSVHLTHCSCAVCVVCWHETQTREGDKAKEIRREKGKKRERRKEQLCICDWTTLLFRELQWPEVLCPSYIITPRVRDYMSWWTVKLKHTFTLIMAMTFNGHPCQTRCYADIQKLSLTDWASPRKGN